MRTALCCDHKEEVSIQHETASQNQSRRRMLFFIPSKILIRGRFASQKADHSTGAFLFNEAFPLRPSFVAL
jgi:hypothetical protein